MKVGIIGLGYVGLPLAVAFAEAGHAVVGVDADPRVVEAIAAGRTHVEDVDPGRLAPQAGRIAVGTNHAPLGGIEAAATKSFGFMRFEPGPGMGGHCPAGGSLLPRLQGARIRLPGRVRGARRAR